MVSIWYFIMSALKLGEPLAILVSASATIQYLVTVENGRACVRAFDS